MITGIHKELPPRMYVHPQRYDFALASLPGERHTPDRES